MGTHVCHLCGKNISRRDFSLEHVPPKAFYPKNIRDGLNLLTVPAHKRCNESYQKDEEYFQHSLYVEVLNKKPPIEKALTNDFKRRSLKPQTSSIIRKILKETSNFTPGGIILPPPIYVVQIDQVRTTRVVLKIAQGLFYSKYNEFLPLERVKDFRFCLNEKEVPEFYKISWKATKREGVYQLVFSYKHFYHSSFKFQLYSMLFWDAVMFCLAVENL